MNRTSRYYYSLFPHGDIYINLHFIISFAPTRTDTYAPTYKTMHSHIHYSSNDLSRSLFATFYYYVPLLFIYFFCHLSFSTSAIISLSLSLFSSVSFSLHRTSCIFDDFVILLHVPYFSCAAISFRSLSLFWSTPRCPILSAYIKHFADRNVTKETFSRVDREY